MFFHLMSKDKANELGIDHFFTGKPCINGGVWLRRSSTSVCQCHICKAKRLIKQKEWVSSNREHINKKARDYSSRPHVKARQAERDKARLEENRDAMNLKKREWYYNNIDHCKIKRAEWIARLGDAEYKAHVKKHGRKRYEKYKEKITKQVIEWRKRNPDKVSMYARATMARRRSAEGTHSACDIKRILDAQKNKCAYCKVSTSTGYHVDHIKPLSRGGSNWPENLQILCPSCNVKKWAHDPIDFAQKQGLLL